MNIGKIEIYTKFTFPGREVIRSKSALPSAWLSVLLSTGAIPLLHAGMEEKQLAPVPPEVSALQTNQSSPADRQYLLGDWGGERTRLADQGVTFDLDDIGDLQTDVSGSQVHHVAYFGRLLASADINFQKLANFSGEFFFSGIWQYGPNLSGQYLNVNTLTSSIAGKDSERVDQCWYQQGFVDEQFKVKLGQVAAVNEFGATDFFDILFNDELGYAPNALFSTKQPFSPAGKPGVILWGDLSTITPGLYVKTGAFTAYDNPYRPDSYGVSYDNDFEHGMVGSFELGYEEPKTNYAGVYRIGVNANNLAVYSNPATGETYRGDYTLYTLAEKTVYHPVGKSGQLELRKGLDLLLEFVQSPGDRNALEYEVTAGARYTGLIPGRDEDKVGLGFIFSENGSAASQAYETINGRSLGGESTVELDYQYNPVSWLTIQPDTQVIVDPSGDDTRSPIVILALRTIVHF